MSEDPFAFLDAPDAKSGMIDKGQRVDLRAQPQWAERAHRQIIEAINEIESSEALEVYWASESVLLDAFYMDQPAYWDLINSAYEDHKAMLRGCESVRDIPPAAGSAAIKSKMNTIGKPMANPDFRKFVFKDVTFSWPRLDQPYRYNPATEKSEPCPANAQGAGYSLAWTMPYSEAQNVFAEMKAHYEDCRTRNSKLPEFSSVFGLKRLKDDNGNETDTAQFTAKKSAISNKGEENKMPTVVDVAHTPLADRAIWGGSTGHVRVLAFASTNPQDKSGGISLLLDAVVVTKAEYGGDGLEDDFGGPAVVDDLPGADIAAAQTTTATASEGAAAGGF